VDFIKKQKILLLQSQYILSLLLFMAKTENNLNLTLRFIALIQDTITISIIQYVI
jgi:hypothetical protein